MILLSSMFLCSFENKFWNIILWMLSENFKISWIVISWISCLISNINNFLNDFFAQFLSSFTNFFSLETEACLTDLSVIVISFNDLTSFSISVWVDIYEFLTYWLHAESCCTEFFYYDVSKYFSWQRILDTEYHFFFSICF